MNFSVETVSHCCDFRYNQGHWELYERVKLNKYHQHTKFEICLIYSVWENHNNEVFAKYRHSADLTLIITWTHIFHASQ